VTRFRRVRRARRVAGRASIAAVYVAGFIAAWTIHPLLPFAPVVLIVAAVAYRWVKTQAVGGRDPRDGDIQ
jgi:CHASE2 domain-containing sensor protein